MSWNNIFEEYHKTYRSHFLSLQDWLETHYNIPVRKMSKIEFEQHRQHWKDDWHDNYRLLDIDFETYMFMHGMSKEDFDKLNKEDLAS